MFTRKQPADNPKLPVITLKVSAGTLPSGVALAGRLARALAVFEAGKSVLLRLHPTEAANLESTHPQFYSRVAHILHA